MERFEPYFYTVEMRSNTYLSDIDHLDIHDFSKLNDFKDNWNVQCSLVDLAGMWGEFMSYKLDCLSCTVTAAYFEEFYNWLKDKEESL